MIQAHVLDSWTSFEARGTLGYAVAAIVAGFAAPLFLFCAGFSVALSAGSKLRRHGDTAAAASYVMKRGAWIFLLAFLFRVQAWFLGWSHNPAALLKVDILNVMGPSIIAAAALWALFRGRAARCVALAAATAIVAFITPAIHETHALDFLPNSIENYLRPPRGSGWFSIFPWTGFVFAGAVPGVLLDHISARDEESRLNVWLAVGGVALAGAAYVLSFLPSVVGPSEFWGGSPSFFFLRAGTLMTTIPFAYVWQRAVVRSSWSALQQLGRTSLFIYWIHVEMVYGLISLRIHKSLTHPQAWIAFAAFATFMLFCSVMKDRIVAGLAARKAVPYATVRSSDRPMTAAAKPTDVAG